MKQRIVILGDGAHANVLSNTARDNNKGDVIMVAPGRDIGVGPNDSLIVGIGVGVDCGIPVHRRKTFQEFDRHGLNWATVVHRSAWVSDLASIGKGVDIGAMAYIGPGAAIGNNVLINAGAFVHHDSTIGDHTVISPGVQILGAVALGNACAIGAGAIIIQGVELDDESRVPAGTLVVGPDDFRKPVPILRCEGTDYARIGPTGRIPKHQPETVSVRADSHVQSPPVAPGEVSSVRPSSDP